MKKWQKITAAILIFITALFLFLIAPGGGKDMSAFAD